MKKNIDPTCMYCNWTCPQLGCKFTNAQSYEDLAINGVLYCNTHNDTELRLESESGFIDY